MRPDEYWTNFNLGTELDIAGRFLFNGLQTFHEMKTFADEKDAFEFLYGVAVGIERLLKIALILTEHNPSVDQTEFEKNLITHSHQSLVNRLKNSHQLDFSGQSYDFIAVLSTFYNSHRYGRYNLASVFAPAKERDDLVVFLEKHLNINIDAKGRLTLTANERRHKEFIGRVTKKIVLPLFKIIKSEAEKRNIYTYEIEYGSKASKIFTRQNFCFEDEDILQMELMAYFMSEDASGANSRFIRELIKPLPFDPACEADYLAALRSDRNKQLVLDELETNYDEVKNFKERRDLLATATFDHLDYGHDEEE